MGGLNTYGYAHGSPLLYIDPFGQQAAVNPKELLRGRSSGTLQCGAAIANACIAGDLSEVLTLVDACYPAIPVDKYKQLEKLTRFFKGVPNKPTTSNRGLQSIYDSLYQTGDKYPGGTAGILRREAVGDVQSNHLMKARERAKQLRDYLVHNGDDLTRADREIAERVLQDLRESIKYAEDLM